MRQSSQNQLQELSTESVDIPGTDLRVARVALGTWAMGGWMWGGTDDRDSVATIRTALGRGINLIRSGPSLWRPCKDPEPRIART
jgi:aryl-alcohol dehydrogenase-like predicted oxidoreductase